ncbi:hypothetical protein PIROE2DRAFT_2631 [Piromyces sp. E2]|nr:hypothetical protein PIROE2DRAFT_2631 [Piromyces sp. E2]|eukprot:OUM69538.1 hypothetical protein PIROE2DRAFT_2631 [Piromyces sp. E2]
MSLFNIFDISTNLNRFSESTNTCANKNYVNIIDGFFRQFQDSFFYANVIQFILVILMYMSVGNGRYWKVLFYASLCGFLGGLIENATIPIICQESARNPSNRKPVITFFINEIFWTLCEYSIPYLNLIKMKAFSQGKVANSIKYTIYILFIPFSIFRLSIGYQRMMKGYLIDSKIQSLHGLVFGIMAISDILCTVFILYYVKKHNEQETLKDGNNIHNYIKHSSYTILIIVDIVSLVLSILHILLSSGLISDNFKKYDGITTPFHCLKSDFILVLATDALLFKYGANASSYQDSSGNNSKTPIGGSGNDSYYYRSRASNNYSNDISNNAKEKSYNNNKTNNTTTYNNSKYNNNNYSNSKSIVKKYTSISSSYMYDTNYNNAFQKQTIEIKPYQSQQFGFLYQQNEYSDLINKKNTNFM